MASLVRKRSTIKQKLTMLEKYVQQTEATLADTESIITSKIKQQMQMRMISYEGLLAEFDLIESQIEEVCEEKDLVGHFNERELFESRYFSVFATLKALLNECRSSRAPSVDSSLNDDVQSNVQQHVQPADTQSVQNIQHAITQVDTVRNDNNFNSIASTPQIQGVKLPTIKLPTYRGSFDNWLEFKDSFNSLIHTNTAINDIQRFHYLRASLEGSAMQVIKSLEFSAANYHNAWDLLCSRYDNRRLLVHNHLKSLFSLEAINKESATQIRQLVDTVAITHRLLGCSSYFLNDIEIR